MKTYLAVFLGKPESMDAWRTMPEAERKQREQSGIAAWHKWVTDHKDAIAEMGSPLVRRSARIRMASPTCAMNWERGRS